MGRAQQVCAAYREGVKEWRQAVSAARESGDASLNQLWKQRGASRRIKPHGTWGPDKLIGT